MQKLAIVALVLAAVGCINERTYVDPAARVGGGPVQSDPGFSRGALLGDVGPIARFNDNRAAVTGYVGDEYGGSSSVTVTGAAPDGTGFVILDFYSMSLATAPAGVYTTNDEEMGDIGVIACSDSHDGSVHFDAMAEEATVEIIDVDADTRQVNVDSVVGGGYDGAFGEQTTQSASFSFER